MRWLINYIRSCFCKHSFTYTERNYIIQNVYNSNIIRDDIRVSALCNKCGYHKSYSKFL